MSVSNITTSARRLLKDENGKVIPVVALADHNGNGDPALDWGLTQFGERIAADRFNVLGLTSVFGTSAIRDITSTNGTGASIARSGAVLELTSGIATDGHARLTSAERAPYIPGSIQEGGIGLRIPSASVPTGDQEIRWGVWDGTDGIYFGRDATGVYAAYSNGGTETKIRQTAWNVDKLDGTGPSALTFDPDAGYVYRMRYAWYGYGGLAWAIVLPDSAGYTQPIPVHRAKVEGALAIGNPNLPIRAAIDNGTTGSNSLTVQVGGRSVSRIGPIELAARRFTAGRNLGFSTTASQVPYVSLRRKSGFANEASVRLSSIQILTTDDCLWEVYMNASPTTASWVTPTGATAAETTLEMDISATSISGGTLIAQGFAKSGSANKSELSLSELPPIDFAGTQPMTLAITNLSTTGTASVIFEAVEGW